MRGEGGIGAGEGFEAIDLRDALGPNLGEGHGTFGLDGGNVAVPNFGDGEPTLGECGLAGAVAEGAEHEFIGADAEGERRAVVVPTACAAAQVDAAAVGDEAGFDGRVGRAEDDGVVPEVGVDVARWWQQRREEFVAGAVGLGHGGLAPEIAFGREGGCEGGEGPGRCGGVEVTEVEAQEENAESCESCGEGGGGGGDHARNFPGGRRSRGRRSGRSGGSWRRRESAGRDVRSPRVRRSDCGYWRRPRLFS